MKKYTIATISKVVPTSHAWFERMSRGVQKFGQETGHKTFLVGPPKADENLQVKILDDIIAQGVDALCVVPIFPQALEWKLRKIRKQGIAVISHEASNQRNVDYNIEAFDNAVFGVHLMDYLAKYMREEGQYTVFVGNLTAESHNEWSGAAINQQKEKYPAMELITRKLEDHDNPNIAYEKTLELITTYPDLKGVLAIGMTATVGAGRAIEEKGCQDDIAIVGVGLVSVCRQYLLSGAIKAITLWDPADAGYVMNKLAVMVLERERITEGMDLGIPGYNNIKMQGKVLVGSAMVEVTKENMAEYNF
jgi:simple sugar transport system substrate-binding protein